MATGGVEFDDGIRHIIDEITCTICREEDRQLCMLPCQHRFCEICLDQLSGKSQKSFRCPSCNHEYKPRKAGFKKCRLSAYVKENLRAVSTTVRESERVESLPAISREDFRDMIQSAIRDEFTQLPNLPTEAGTETRASLRAIRCLEKWCQRKRDELLPAPDLLSNVYVSSKLLSKRLYDAADSEELHCAFTFPINNIRIGDCISTQIVEEYACVGRKGITKKQFLYSGNIRILSIHRSQSSSNPTDFDCFIQCQRPQHNSCCVHYIYPSRGRLEICTCSNQNSNPYFLYKLNSSWEQVRTLSINCRTICVCNGSIYGINNPSLPRRECVLKYSSDGQLISQIRHPNMLQPEYLKAKYITELKKQVLLVSDPTAKKLFLFLDDEYCWQWQPEDPSCEVGAVALSVSTGHVYAVITDDVEGYSWIQILNLQGNMIGQLKFVSYYESRRMIRDIEAVCLRKAHVDNLFVMCKENQNEAHFVTRRWQKYELISRRSGIVNLKSITAYWWSITDTTWIKLGFGLTGMVFLASLFVASKKLVFSSKVEPSLPLPSARPPQSPESFTFFSLRSE